MSSGLIERSRADPDHAGAAVGVLLEADHLRAGAQGVPRDDGLVEAALRVTQVGHRVEHRDDRPQHRDDEHHQDRNGFYRAHGRAHVL